VVARRNFVSSQSCLAVHTFYPDQGGEKERGDALKQFGAPSSEWGEKNVQCSKFKVLSSTRIRGQISSRFLVPLDLSSLV
jgi:hypothetical protein